MKHTLPRRRSRARQLNHVSIRNAVNTAGIVALALVLKMPASRAAESVAPASTSAETASSVSKRSKKDMGRPSIPASFDVALVQQYLDDIEGPRMASILKIGYFNRRGTHALPVHRGFGLLLEAIDKEPVASSRWFLLQNVRGWAAFRCPEVDPAEGMEAYKAIFEQAGKVKEAGAQYAFSQSVNEFLVGVLGPAGDIGLLSEKKGEVKSLMLQAWKGYCGYTADSGPWPNTEPYWCEAVEQAGAEKEFTPEAEAIVTDKKNTHSYGVMFLCARLLGQDKPQRGLELLRQARPLMPHDENGKELTPELARYYDQMVDFSLDLYLHQEVKRGKKRDPAHLREAVICQKERVTASGRGWARLIQLQCWAEDDKALKQSLNQLVAPRVPADEINEAAETLINLWQETEFNDKAKREQQRIAEAQGKEIFLHNQDFEEVRYPQAGWQATVLLTGYLNYENTLSYLDKVAERDIGQELRARFNLGSLYMATGKLDEARNILDVSSLQIEPSQLNGEPRFYYTELKKLEETRKSRLLASRS